MSVLLQKQAAIKPASQLKLRHAAVGNQAPAAHLQQGSPQVCHLLLDGWVLLLKCLQRS